MTQIPQAAADDGTPPRGGIVTIEQAHGRYRIEVRYSETEADFLWLSQDAWSQLTEVATLHAIAAVTAERAEAAAAAWRDGYGKGRDDEARNLSLRECLADPSADNVVHSVGEEDDEPLCFTTDAHYDANGGALVTISQNSTRVTCAVCRHLLDDPAEPVAGDVSPGEPGTIHADGQQP